MCASPTNSGSSVVQATLKAYGSVPFPLALCDLSGRITFFNQAFCDMFGEVGENTGRTCISDFIAPEIDGKLQAAQPITGQKQVALMRRSDGDKFWCLLTCSDAGLDSDTYCSVIQVAEIDALKSSHDTLLYRESTWRHAISDSKHGVWDYDIRTDTLFLSDEWKRLRGLQPDADTRRITEDWSKNIHPDDYAKVMEWNAKLSGGEIDCISYEYREKRADGSWIWILSRGRAVEQNDDGKPTRIVGIDVDITETKTEEEERVRQVKESYRSHLAEIEAARQEAEKERHRASVISNQDALTELANRRAFSAHLKEFVADAATGSGTGMFYLFLVDLDRFKPINDTYGHTVGDLVLREVATRIGNTVCQSAVAARLGGDEFGIIIPCIDPDKGDRNAQAMADAIVKAVRAPFLVNGMTLYTGASVGIVRFPDYGRDEATLMRRADIAMYHAKKDPSASTAFFLADMERRAVSRTELEADVRRAVEHQDILPFFQPIVDLSDNRIAGFEVLARWPSAKHSGIGPLQFIPIIEQFGLMREFGSSILKQTTATAVKWGQDCKISLNMSASGISNRTVARRILNYIKDSGFPTDQLEIEVSEMAQIEDMALAASIMDEMRDHGVRFALDDFGVGYSGLTYLRVLRFETLKLDRSFISTMDSCVESEKIVRSVLALADEFGMETVAEGIETEAVRRMVADMGFSHGQGYLFGKAVPATDAEAMLDRQANRLRQVG